MEMVCLFGAKVVVFRKVFKTYSIFDRLREPKGRPKQAGHGGTGPRAWRDAAPGMAWRASGTATSLSG